eukprot:4497431-Prymnesium_polylepis.1
MGRATRVDRGQGFDVTVEGDMPMGARVRVARPAICACVRSPSVSEPCSSPMNHWGATPSNDTQPITMWARGCIADPEG